MHYIILRVQLKNVAHFWLQAGADVICTATYQVTMELLRTEFKLSEERGVAIFRSSIVNLDETRREFWQSLSKSEQETRRFPKIAISCGPYSAIAPGMSEYSSTYDEVPDEELRKFHHSRSLVYAKLFSDDSPCALGSNIFCFETIGNMREAVSIVDIMDTPEFNRFPYWISIQCKDAKQTATGDLLSSAVLAILQRSSHQNLVAIGVNCVEVSFVVELAKVVRQTIERFMAQNIGKDWRVATIVYPNNGEYWSEEGWAWPPGKQLSCHDWAKIVYSSNANIVGGCCRTGPNHILALKSI